MNFPVHLGQRANAANVTCTFQALIGLKFVPFISRVGEGVQANGHNRVGDLVIVKRSAR